MREQSTGNSEVQTFNVGDVVSLPAARHGEYTGTIGTIAGQVYHDPSDSTSVCLVSIPGHGPTIVFAVSDLQPMDEAAAIQELVTRWSYRDITDLVRRVNEQLDLEFDYLCVLQEPDGSPVYCRQARRLFKELNEARAESCHYEQCPAPDPEKNLWMVIGNFDDEDEVTGAGPTMPNTQG